MPLDPDGPVDSTGAPASGARSSATPYRYAAFVLHCDADEPFVRNFLVPALAIDRERLLLSSDFTPGAPLVAEIERGVTTSAVTIAVLSPAYLRDRWARFSDELAGYASGSGARLVPLLLAPCKAPLALRFRVMLDFTDRTRWDEEVRHLRDSLPTPGSSDVFAPDAETGSDPPPPSASGGTNVPAEAPGQPPAAGLGRSWVVAAPVAIAVIAGSAVAARHATARSQAAPSSGARESAAGSSEPAAVAAMRSTATPAATTDAEVADAGEKSGEPVPVASRKPRPHAVDGTKVPDETLATAAVWDGLWTNRVSGADEYVAYRLRVTNGRVIVESGELDRTSPDGTTREPLQIVAQQWGPPPNPILGSTAIQWTVARPSKGSTFIVSCPSPSGPRLPCDITRPDDSTRSALLLLTRSHP